MATLNLPITEQHGEYSRDRAQYAGDLAQEMFEALLEAARDATSVDDIFEHLSVFLTDEQLAHARASNVPAARRVISDEV